MRFSDGEMLGRRVGSPVIKHGEFDKKSGVRSCHWHMTVSARGKLITACHWWELERWELELEPDSE